MDKSYLLEIYDAEEFSGPNPLPVKGMGIIQGPENTHYFIIEAQRSASTNGSKINHLAIRAHYNGDSINRITDSEATVGIALLNNGHGNVIDFERKFGFADFTYWKVGKIRPRITT